MSRGPGGRMTAAALLLAMSLGIVLVGSVQPDLAGRIVRWAEPALPPDFAVLARVWPEIVETAAMALAGTLLAALIAAIATWMILAVPAAPGAVLRLALALLRAIPALALAAMLVLAVGTGATAGAAAIALHGAGRLAPDWLAAAQGVDPAPGRALDSAGASALQRFRHADWPQMAPDLLAALLATMARALRDGSVVGLVGAGGLGGPLFAAIEGGALREVVALALIMLAVLLAGEALARRLRRGAD